MRRFHTLLVFLLLLIILNGCSAKTSSNQDYDFRNVRWGMSKEEVKKANSEDDLETIDELTTKSEVGSQYFNKDNYFCYESTDFPYADTEDFIFTYFSFSKGKLDGAGYELDSTSAPTIFESEESLDEFTEKIVADMTKKYGKPEKEEGGVKGLLKTDNYSWETKRTSIDMKVRKGSVSSEVRIWYSTNEEEAEEDNDL